MLLTVADLDGEENKRRREQRKMAFASILQGKIKDRKNKSERGMEMIHLRQAFNAPIAKNKNRNKSTVVNRKPEDRTTTIETPKDDLVSVSSSLRSCQTVIGPRGLGALLFATRSFLMRPTMLIDVREVRGNKPMRERGEEGGGRQGGEEEEGEEVKFGITVFEDEEVRVEAFSIGLENQRKVKEGTRKRRERKIRRRRRRKRDGNRDKIKRGRTVGEIQSYRSPFQPAAFPGAAGQVEEYIMPKQCGPIRVSVFGGEAEEEEEEEEERGGKRRGDVEEQEQDGHDDGHHVCLSYLVTTAPTKGKFFADRAKALGVPPGPLFGRLQVQYNIS